MTSVASGAHIGAFFSCADILAVRYGGILHVDPTAPRSSTRYRFVLSKGHAGAGLMPPSASWVSSQHLPYTDWLFTRLLMLPINMSLSDDDVNYVCDGIRRFYRR